MPASSQACLSSLMALAGHVNISAYTYELIRQAYTCTYRGKILAKGKGEIDMYFVNVAKPPMQ